LLLLSVYYPIRRRDGEVMALLMVTYPITRLLIEYLRNDEPAFFAGLTISQNVSLLLLVCGLLYWFRLAQWPPVRMADSVERPECEPLVALAK
jgi:phosphatidylglycerol:prolipoprotein diacylglycerol transferase